MNKNIKKIVSVLVASSMLLSLAGCKDKANEQVLEAVDGFASAVQNMNAKKIKGACTEDLDDEDAEAIDYICDIANWDTEDNVALINVVKDSLQYEIDEDSVDASTKDGEGSVDVVFTMLDWESVMDDEDALTDLDTAIAALEDADTTEVTVTVEFELEDDEWVVTNGYDVIYDVYQFADKIDVTFLPPIQIEELRWWSTDNGTVDAYTEDGVYTNTYMIDLWMTLSDYNCDLSNLYYVVESNGSVLYTSDMGENDGYYDSEHGATFDDNGYIPEGTYTITFFNGDEEIATGTCNVYVDVYEPDPVEPDFGDFSNMSVGEVINLENESAFYANTNQAVFYDVENDVFFESGAYASGVSVIQLTAQADPSFNESVCYAWAYSATGNFDDAEEIYESTCAPATYGENAFYDFTLDATSIPDGGYWCVVADAAQQTPYVIGYCTVG